MVPFFLCFFRKTTNTLEEHRGMTLSQMALYKSTVIWRALRRHKSNAILPIYINLQLNLQRRRTLFISSCRVGRAENNNLSDKTKCTSDSNKHESIVYTKALWESLLSTPYKWCDYRFNKKNQKVPDFRNIVTGEVLWIESNKTPVWALYKLRCLRREAFAPLPSIDDLWRSLFADPSKWHNNRKIRKSNKHPDFVQKDTYEALWIDDKKIPAWVTPRLFDLQGEEFAATPSMENCWKSLFAHPSEWIDNRINKPSNKHPDFKHKSTDKALWIHDTKTPAWVASLLGSLQDEVFATSSSIDDQWKSLFVDPSKWFDNRKIKKSNKHPDFKHKDTGEALWINCRETPMWVMTLLNNLQDEAFTTMENMGKALFDDPSKWMDKRKIKKSNKHPDFKHKDTDEALLIIDRETPFWVPLMLNNLKDEAFATSPSNENLWKSLFANPSEWIDKRKIKKTNKHPDFKNKDTHEALWIYSRRTPSWVIPMLINLQDEAFASQDGVFASSETKWKAFFSSPSKWCDNRTNKKNPNAPDFKNVDTDEALWINRTTSTWIISELSKLGNDAFSPSNA